MNKLLQLGIMVFMMAAGFFISVKMNEEPELADVTSVSNKATVNAQADFSTEQSNQTLTPTDKPLPAFSLSGVDGTLYSPEPLKGKTWLINFWAVWCAPCLEELPSLNRAWAQLQENNVGMLAINIGEDAEKIDQFLKDNNLQIDFPIVIGDKLHTLSNWSIQGLPHTVVVNPEGVIVFEASGPREWDDQRFIEAITATTKP